MCLRDGDAQAYRQSNEQTQIWSAPCVRQKRTVLIEFSSYLWT